MNSKLLREIFIILLLVMVIIFTIGLLFYDCIPKSSETIESIEYIEDEAVTDTLNKIKETTGEDVADLEENSLLKSYSIGKEDLAEYAEENYYESGKKDPFAEYSETVEEEVITTTSTSANTTNIEASSNTYQTTSINTSASDSIANTTTTNEKNTVKESTSSVGTYFETTDTK